MSQREEPPASHHAARNASDTTDTQSQMSDSGGAARVSLPAEGGKWSCDVCTYENFPLSRKCTMCRSPKPVLGEDIFRLQDGASALPERVPDRTPERVPDRTPERVSDRTPERVPDRTPERTPDCGAEAVCDRVRPLRISSPHAHDAHKWPCPTCTYENWPKSLKCAMCGTGSPLPHSHAALDKREKDVHTPVGINELCNSQTASLVELEGGKRSKRRNNMDWIWLQACLGVVEGDSRCVEAYLLAGGDPARALTAREVALLDRASAFDTGHTLVHLAIRFQRQDILSMLLSRISGGGPGIKRSPSYIAPDLAAAIRRHLASCVRHRKGAFPARYINELATFSLPPEIEELPIAIQDQVFAELLDRDAQRQLEQHPATINWSRELTCTLGSRLYALWNRSLGDCLPDAVCQAAYGVFDRHNVLRSALADTLAARALADRWAQSERAQAAALQYTPDESQLRGEWSRLQHAAATPGTPLHQIHVLGLAHVMRRPIIVYGVNVVTSFRGEPLGYASFQGIYLPLLWEPDFCSKSPLCLGYTRGHFSALVAMEPYPQTHTYICQEQEEEDVEECIYLPLTDCDGKLLPIHFLTCEEMCCSESILRRWVRTVVTEGGLLCGRQRLHPRPLPQAQMLEEWLNHYRRQAQESCGGVARGGVRAAGGAPDLSSDPDTDDE